MNPLPHFGGAVLAARSISWWHLLLWTPASLGREQFWNADQDVVNEVEQKIGGEAGNAAMFVLRMVACCSPLAAFAGAAVIEAMLHVYPGRDGAYIYGPICVADSERGRGLAAKLISALRMQLPRREGILFIRRDNVASLKAHKKMGIQEVGEFTHRGVIHAVLAYNF